VAAASAARLAATPYSPASAVAFASAIVIGSALGKFARSGLQQAEVDRRGALDRAITTKVIRKAT